MLGRVQPGDEDRADAGLPAGAPGDVLSRPPAARREIAGALHPEGELVAAGLVAEAVAADDVAGLFPAERARSAALESEPRPSWSRA